MNTFFIEHLPVAAFFIDDTIPLRNLELFYRSQNFFSPEVSSCELSHERVSCLKNGTSRQFDRIKYVFKIWFKRSEKSSIVDTRLGSKIARLVMLHNITLNITSHLTFLKSL